VFVAVVSVVVMPMWSSRVVASAPTASICCIYKGSGGLPTRSEIRTGGGVRQS
jgi:hypothetical protein